jgi:EF hand
MTETVMRRRAMLGTGAVVLGLTLLTSGCADNSSKPMSSPNPLFGNSDINGDNTLTPDEWDRAYKGMDTNGDGVVSLDEFNAAILGVGRGGG